MEKLIAGIMGQDAMKFLPMCLESLKEADKLVYIDGGSKDNSVEFAKSKGCEVIEHIYDQKDKGANGKQRNVFLNYIKEKYPNEWCLFCDADEVVEDLSKIKKVIQELEPALYNVHMRHLIGDLSHEDAVHDRHYVQGRLFKINEAEKYPEGEHPVLQGNGYGQIDDTTIWHLSYISETFNIKKKYENHLKKSEIHSKEYLRHWNYQHLLGLYPVKQFNVLELPKVITDNFNIDRDELYFMNRKQFEAKHYQDCIDWKNYFNKHNSATLIGCGFGQRVKILNEISDIDTTGIELNEYAAKYAYSDVRQGNVIDYEMVSDLTVAYDILEHLEYNDLDKAINNMIKNTNKHILISVPFKGTPNCDNDPTHIIKEDEKWWTSKFLDKGLIVLDTPDNFLFKKQVLIFEK